jgi:serine/threonine protein phosphatase PrpC
LQQTHLSLAADDLMQQCLQAGAPDNVSMVLLDVLARESGSAPAPT